MLAPMQQLQQVLVVCMGNICRSPIASAVLQAEVQRRGLQGRVVVESAGVYGGHAGERADSRARQLAKARGYMAIEAERARGVSEGDFERFDAILAMDEGNLSQLRRRCPPAQSHKLHLFLDYAGLGFEEVPDRIRRAAPRVIERLTGAPDAFTPPQAL
jgi:protein-tyrosine phosphatase